jgi:hypothetical protein
MLATAVRSFQVFLDLPAIAKLEGSAIAALDLENYARPSYVQAYSAKAFAGPSRCDESFLQFAGSGKRGNSPKAVPSLFVSRSASFRPTRRMTGDDRKRNGAFRMRGPKAVIYRGSDKEAYGTAATASHRAKLIR